MLQGFEVTSPQALRPSSVAGLVGDASANLSGWGLLVLSACVLERKGFKAGDPKADMALGQPAPEATGMPSGAVRLLALREHFVVFSHAV